MTARLTRPVLLSASAAPVLLVAAVAYASGRLDPLRGALLLAAAVAGQSGVNLISGYFDLKNGVPAAGAPRPEIAVAARPGEALFSGLVRLGAAAAAGVWLAVLAGWRVAALGAAVAALAYAYAADPIRYKYRPWGLLVVVALGALIGLLASVALLGSVEPVAWPLAAAGGAWAAAIVHAGDLRDREALGRAGFAPPAVRLGARGSAWLYALLLTAGYAAFAAAAAARLIAPPGLLALLTLPWALIQVRRAMIAVGPAEVAWLDVRTARVLWAFAVLGAAGIAPGGPQA